MIGQRKLEKDSIGHISHHLAPEVEVLILGLKLIKNKFGRTNKG